VTPWGSGTCSKRARLVPEEPAVVVRGRGCRVWDAGGKEYIDYRNGLGPITLGYCYREVDDAIVAQLREGIIFGHPSPLECEVAEMICDLRPQFGMVKFLKTGGEANAAAIRIARAYTGKKHVIQVGYNGWLNSLARGARAIPGRAAEAAVPGVPPELGSLHHIARYGDALEAESLLEEFAGSVAAIVVAAGYPDFYSGDPYYKLLRALCDKHGTLLVCDEIVTGFRYATAGVSEFFGFESDLSVYAKGFANGMPISALAGKKDIMRICDINGEVVVSSTYAGELLSLAAAKATIGIFKKDSVVDHMWNAGKKLCEGANSMFERYGAPLEYKGAWPAMTLTAKEDPQRNGDEARRIGNNARRSGNEAVDDFLRLSYKHGIALYTQVYVNYSHKDADIDETLDKWECAIKEFCGKNNV
jgi:glutamate-1-semialdehyde 2,1-aminomutase